MRAGFEVSPSLIPGGHRETSAKVSEGTELFVHRACPMYQDVGSWEVKRLLGLGEQITAAGAPQQGYGVRWVPVAPSGVVELAALSTEQVELPSPPKYQQLPLGTKECPPGLAVQTAEECEAAIVALGLVAQPSWVSNFPGLPSYCSFREKVSSGSPERMHFNSAKNGVGRDDLAPICRTAPEGSVEKSGAVKVAAAVARRAAEAALRRIQAHGQALEGADVGLPHVRGATQRELAAHERAADQVKPALQAASAEAKKASGSAPPSKLSGQGKSGAEKQKPAPTGTVESRVAEKRAELRRASAYRQLEFGAAGCPAGLEIRSVDECEVAILSLGLVSRPHWVSNFEGVPSFCSVREEATKGSPERMHFNAAPGGRPRPDLAPICKKPPGEHDDDAEEIVGLAGAALPELWGATQEELLGGSDLCFVFLSEGPITAPHTLMLRALMDRLQPRLQDRGAMLHWMWLDLRAERKLKDVFDPPALPSAVVLDPGRAGKGAEGRPRFAAMRHAEEDGDPRPADAESLELFLNTVLGGDVRFVPIPPKRLVTGWSKRSA